MKWWWTAVVQRNGKVGRVGITQLTYRRSFRGPSTIEWMSQGGFDELVFFHELYSAVWEAIFDPRIILPPEMKQRMEDELGHIVLPSAQRMLSLRPQFGQYRLVGRRLPKRAVRLRLVPIQLAAVSTIEFTDVQNVSN